MYVICNSDMSISLLEGTYTEVDLNELSTHISDHYYIIDCYKLLFLQGQNEWIYLKLCWDEAIVTFITIHLLPKSVNASCGFQMEDVNEMCVHIIQGWSCSIKSVKHLSMIFKCFSFFKPRFISFGQTGKGNVFCICSGNCCS